MPSRQKENTDNSKIFGMGEEKAFDYFFRQYYAALCFFAKSILHDEDEAKDVVQDCFLKLWDSQTMIERSASVRSFLYTAVRNKCVDVLRRKKTKQKAELQLIQNNENDSEYFDEVTFAEMIRQLDGYLDELPSKMRHIMKLYYIDGKKYHEIASKINSTPEAVRRQKARALHIIREKFRALLSFF